MKRAGVALLALALVAADAPPPAKPAAMPDWMAGEWADVRTGSTMEEHWSKPLAGQMLGYSRTWSGGRSVSFWEANRIESDAKAGMLYWANPDGAGWFSFPLEKAEGQSISFANAAHDYPQRIKYWREGNTLHASISLIDGSKARTWRYRLRAR